jgi:hypothetical protein
MDFETDVAVIAGKEPAASCEVVRDCCYSQRAENSLVVLLRNENLLTWHQSCDSGKWIGLETSPAAETQMALSAENSASHWMRECRNANRSLVAAFSERLQTAQGHSFAATSLSRLKAEEPDRPLELRNGKTPAEMNLPDRPRAPQPRDRSLQFVVDRGLALSAPGSAGPESVVQAVVVQAMVEAAALTAAPLERSELADCPPARTAVVENAAVQNAAVRHTPAANRM